MENEDRISRLARIADERRAALMQEVTLREANRPSRQHNRGGYSPPPVVYDAFEVASVAELRSYEQPRGGVEPEKYKSETWVVIGIQGDRGFDTLAHAATEDQARNFLGKVTGDRHYDMRPTSDTVSRALAMEQRQEGGHMQGRWGNEPTYGMNYAVPILYENEAVDGKNPQLLAIAKAQFDARLASRIEAVETFRKEHPIKAFLGGDDYVQAMADETDKGLLHRPSDRIFGRDQETDYDDRLQAQRYSMGRRL